MRAARVIVEVSDEGRNLNEALQRRWHEEPDLIPAARAAIQDLSYSTLRDYGHGDFVLRQLLHRPLPVPTLRALLLAALHRLDARPQEAHTTVDQAVEAVAALSRGPFAGVVNGVLRNYLRRHQELQPTPSDEQAYWRHPQWWIRRVRQNYPAEWEGILAAGNRHPPMTLRVNRRRCTPKDYLDRLGAAGMAGIELGGAAVLLERPVPVQRLPGFAQGEVSIQDAGAQQAAYLLDLEDGQRVLDACAAPGGKTGHILECADVELVALDADAARVGRISENLSRLGVRAGLQVADARQPQLWWDGKPFDRVLADVPCSASGVVRRHPDIKWLRREQDVAGFARVQQEILEALWRVLAPGGKLLYATCSLFPEENGHRVAEFVARQQDCARLPIRGEPEFQLLPTDTHDGFFYALLQKRG